jgi:Leucine-rich repeat (LRR) protein
VAVLACAAALTCGDDPVDPVALAPPVSSSAMVMAAATDSDRAALAAFYEATGGRNWTKRDSWLTDAPLGEWHGVETDADGRVTTLDLEENGLAGEIPSELGDLAALERLDLSDNQVGGSIPSEIGNLSNLRRLRLARNHLEGPIPRELGDLSKLEELSLARNRLTGAIPPAIGRMSSLKWLSLSRNFFKGTIPPEVGDLSSLVWMRLEDSGLTGSIPSELGNLSNLDVIDLTDNSLTGPIPAELWDLGIRSLRFARNRLTGPVPVSALRRERWLLDLRENAGLCIPGTAGFAEWARGIEYFHGPFCNEADAAALRALYEGADGPEWKDADGWGEAAIGDWHGVATDSLGRVVSLDLTGNELAGQVPAALGELARMTVLRLGSNALSGRLPVSLARIPLVEFNYAETGLCTPSGASFREWLAGIATHEGTEEECAPVSDRAALEELYEATDGPNWKNRDNWLTEAPLADWHGVRTDDEGRVTQLRLRENGLSGRLPVEIADLRHLTWLDLAGNGLEGSIPPEIGNLSSLGLLNLGHNRLSGPIPAELSRLVSLWYLSVRRNRLTGPIPPGLGELANLERLYAKDNLLTASIPPELGNLRQLKVLELAENQLSGPIPPELANTSNLVYLDLGENNLTGRIPPELGNLSRLEELILGRPLLSWTRKGTDIRGGGGKSKTLTGPIPPEFGNLARLRELHVASHSLTGSIPPELGQLAELETFYADDNFLTGPMPAELGDLSRIEDLSLTRNRLTGPVPPELGRLARLVRLDLEYNALSGALPGELGGLAALEWMALGFNRLEGPLPATFGSLASLEAVRLSDNPGLSGALPQSLTALEELSDLAAGGTGLCAPSDTGFGDWLAAIPNRWIARCDRATADAYLVQAVQSRAVPVPLVAGDDALVRVFPTATTQTEAGIPAVRVRLFVDGRETHVEDIPGKAGPLPTEVDEGSLETSANAAIPGSLIQPGLEMVVEIDPDGTLDSSLGVARRIPETGRTALEVAAIPLELTLVPFLRSDDPDSLVLDLTARMAGDPHNDPALWNMKTLLAVNDEFEVTLHEPVWTSDNSNYGPAWETQALQVLEGATGHYMAMLTEDGVSTGLWETRTSLIYVKGRSGTYRMGDEDHEESLGGLIAHEMGHAMTLGHTTGCKPAQRDGYLDPSFPYPTGVIGAWGWDPRLGGSPVRPGHWEVMSPCDWTTGWISDYNFARMVRHRLRYDLPAPASRLCFCGEAWTRPVFRSWSRHSWSTSPPHSRTPPARTPSPARTARGASCSRSTSPSTQCPTARGTAASCSPCLCGPGGRTGSRASRWTDPVVPPRWTGRRTGPWPSCATRQLAKCGGSCVARPR